MRTPIDTSIINDVRTSPNIDLYLQNMIPKIELTHEIAKQNISDCNKSTQLYHDGDSAYSRYKIGQKVLLFDPVTLKGVCKKLKRRWVGPFFITAEGDGYVYKLRRCNNGKELKAYAHSNRLRPFHDSCDLFYTRNPPSTTSATSANPSPPTDSNTTNTNTTNLGDAWYEIDKITSRRMIGGKPHFYRATLC